MTVDWMDAFPGFWNGLTAWLVLVVHIFGAWGEFPIYDLARNGNWYAFGFLVGAGSPLLGAAGAGARHRALNCIAMDEPLKQLA